MRIDARHLENEKGMMTDFWSFRREYFLPEDDQTYWHNLVVASEELHQKYNNSYLDQLILVCVDDIDNRARMKDMVLVHTKEELLMKLVNRFVGKKVTA